MPVFPPPLKPGGAIGIVSPGRWAERVWIDEPKAFFESRGYRVVVHPQNNLRDGQLAGSDAARAEAIMDMFADTSIDAIICARGGTGSLRLLDKLDYELIRKNPKPFIGYSDISLLVNAISQRCGFVTYHGPLGWNFAQSNNDPRTISDLLAALGGSQSGCKRLYPEAECVRPGNAEGVLVGGNISLLQSLIGTPYDWSGQDAILFIEDVDEALYKIDRALNHFRLAGKFEGVRAILVGEMVDITDGETSLNREGEKPYGRTLRQIVEEHVPSGIPLCFNFPCGHGKYIATLPVGARAALVLNSRGAELSFGASCS
jgi:muramoyltetrapeptide carboxypeptidase